MPRVHTRITSYLGWIQNITNTTANFCNIWTCQQPTLQNGFSPMCFLGISFVCPLAWFWTIYINDLCRGDMIKFTVRLRNTIKFNNVQNRRFLFGIDVRERKFIACVGHDQVSIVHWTMCTSLLAIASAPLLSVHLPMVCRDHVISNTLHYYSHRFNIIAWEELAQLPSTLTINMTLRATGRAVFVLALSLSVLGLRTR